MKSYGRAPTFLAMTGYEQVRSVAAALAGDLEAADRVELTLPETGVCGGAGLFDEPERPGGRRWRLLRARAAARPDRRPRRGRGGCRAGSGGRLLRLVTDLSTARGAATGTGDRSRPRAALPALCATQIVSWGIVYYAFPVLNPQITAATGWPAGATTAAFSLGLVVSALAGIRVGRILDRRGPRTVMTVGSVLGVGSLLIVAAAPNIPVFIAGWALAGLAMAATFYQPAFAALTRWWAPNHVRALTVVTLAGGLASTVFAPLTAALADYLSWRATYLVLAGLLGRLTIPAHALALRAPWPDAPPAPVQTPGSATVARSRPFWLLATAFTLSAFAMYAVVVALVPLLLERGYRD